MTEISTNILILAQRKIPSELILWLPWLKDMVFQSELTAALINDGSTESTPRSDFEFWGIPLIENLTPEAMSEFSAILIADSPNNLAKYKITNLKELPLGCFFGGLRPASLQNQVEDAKKFGISFMLSDLLPSELEGLLDENAFNFFCKKSIFTPAPALSSVNQEAEKREKTTYILDSSSRAHKDHLDSLFFEFFNQNPDCTIIDLASINSTADFSEITSLRNCKNIFVNHLPISFSHFISDFCNINGIRLCALKKQDDLSFERTFLSPELLEKKSILRIDSYRSVREIFQDINCTQGVRIKSHNPPELTKGYSLKEGIRNHLSKSEPNLGDINVLEILQKSQAEVYNNREDNILIKNLDPFNLLQKNPYTISRRNSWFHAKKTIFEKVKFKKDEFYRALADDLLDEFIEEETTDERINSFLRIINGQEYIFIESLISKISCSPHSQRKIKLLRLLFYSGSTKTESSKVFSGLFSQLTQMDIPNEFKLLASVLHSDQIPNEQSFKTLFESSDKIRFFKFLKFHLDHTLEYSDTTKFFLSEILPHFEESVPIHLRLKADILSLIQRKENTELQADQIEDLFQLANPDLLGLCFHGLLHQRIKLLQQLQEVINSKELTSCSYNELLLTLSLSLLLGEDKKIEQCFSKLINLNSKINLSENHPFLIATTLRVCAHFSSDDNLMACTKQTIATFAGVQRNLVEEIIANAIMVKDNKYSFPEPAKMLIQEVSRSL